MNNFFVANLAVKVGFAFMKQKVGAKIGAILFGGPIGLVLGFFLEKFLNQLLNAGIIKLDIVIEKARGFMSREDYKKFVRGAYEKASAKVYDEDTKKKIRQDYLIALRGFAPIAGKLR